MRERERERKKRVHILSPSHLVPFLVGRRARSGETSSVPEWATGGGGGDLNHGVSHGQRTEKDGEQEKSHIEVACGGHSKEAARWLVEEVDGKRSEVEEGDILDKANGRQQWAEEYTKAGER